MCGFAGFLTLDPKDEHREIVQKMGDALRHRGPDDSGQWSDRERGVFFAHRRLSILDVSPDGRQPMTSRDGNWILLFNGEIYNYIELKNELGEIPLRGTSDTEVLLEAIARWGIEDTLTKLNGMFAFAVWDRANGVLTLARDRAGEKPLYYGWNGDQFFFASELKALRIHPQFRPRLDPRAAALFLQLSYIPAPHSIYEGIAKLPPGTFASLAHAPHRKGVPRLQPYWSSIDRYQQANHRRRTESSLEQVNRLEQLLSDAVKIRMRADVPVGAFLSGGIDSSLIVSLMQQHSSHRVRTFTIGFSESAFNEAEYAKAIAQHLGTEHTELYISPLEAQATIPLLPRIYDEPLADSSQIPTYLVSKLARASVSVSLSGDGGDELFGGYHRHLWAEKVAALKSSLPGPLSAALSKTLLMVRSQAWERGMDFFSPWFAPGKRIPNLGEKVSRLAQLLTETSSSGIYFALVSQWRDPERLWVADVLDRWAPSEDGPLIGSLTERLMWLDFHYYLPDDILAKLDRASMAVSLEGRLPFLDPRVIEFAWQMPLDSKIRDGQGKQALRALLKRHLPSGLFERPKMGFSIPIDQWLRSALRDWAEALLSEKRLADEGWLHAPTVARTWAEHLSGKANHAHRLWNLLMLQAWREQACL